MTLVSEFHGAIAHDVEEPAGSAVLHEDGLAAAGDVFHDRRRDALERLLVEVLERRVVRQEPGSLSYAFRGTVRLAHDRLPVYMTVRAARLAAREPAEVGSIP
jgi:hypothetical protein